MTRKRPAKATHPERSGVPTVQLQVKVVPGSSRDAVAGWLGHALKVRVRAPAERGRANEAVEQAVADALGLPLHAVRVAHGTTSPRKVLEISGLSEPTIRARLAQAIE